MSRKMDEDTTVLAALVLIIGVALVLVVLVFLMAQAEKERFGLPVNVQTSDLVDALNTECATEDSDNCHWIAERQGNGRGISYLVIDGDTYPIDLLLYGRE